MSYLGINFGSVRVFNHRRELGQEFIKFVMDFLTNCSCSYKIGLTLYCRIVTKMASYYDPTDFLFIRCYPCWDNIVSIYLYQALQIIT